MVGIGDALGGVHLPGDSKSVRKADVLMELWDRTHIWQSAIVADRDLGLVCVDEDPRVSMRATAAIASYHAVVSPVDRLLVDELDGRVGLGL